MLYVDIPDRAELAALMEARADACVSIYLATTAQTQDIDKARIEFGNLTKQASQQLEDAGFDKRRLASLHELFDDIADDDAFWRFQATSLAVLATPDRVRTFRLANRVNSSVAVSDRFHLKPLLRAVTFPHAAVVLALSENAVRAVEIAADSEVHELKIADLPKDAASAVGKSTINDRSHSRRIHGSEGQKVQLTKYIRVVEGALRPVLAGKGLPLILAATEPLASLFRSVANLEALPGTVTGEIDTMSEANLADAARPVLDKYYRTKIDAFFERFEARASDGRATTDMSDAARAATFGAIDTLLVDMDSVVNGTVDDESGAIVFSEEEGAASYGIVDEIASRAWLSGAQVMAVRKEDLPEGQELAAILRYRV
ncbi:hypothetical protein [Devosia alba]|uniref:baeRF11 domain-containing protein n=1 Tax=Devosia alba TaxID=3152360 RepID=UPI003262E621